MNNYKELKNYYYNYYNEFETTNHKLFALNIKENIDINLNEFSTYLYAKIFTKYNDILDSFLIYMKKRKKLSKSKTISNTNTKEKNFNEKNNEIFFKFNNKYNNNNKDFDNNPDNPNNNSIIKSQSILKNHFINEALYPIVKSFKDINPDNIELILIT